MSKSIKINLDLGDGIDVDQSTNKVGVSYENNGNITTESDGLFVDDLNGEDGSGGGSVVDGYTIYNGTAVKVSNPSATLTPFPDIDRGVCQMIFTLGLFWRSRRNPSTIDYSTTTKDVDAMCNEINAPCYYNRYALTSFKPAVGELIQLVENPTFRTIAYNGSTIAVENFDRNSLSSMKTRVMFVIKAIRYMKDVDPSLSDYMVNDMTLKCIYSDNVERYVVGNDYTGSYDPQNGVYM
jgi:hypothetical protein